MGGKLLGLDMVPTIKAVGLSEAHKRLFAIADNKLAENAGWDRDVLAREFAELAELLEREGLDLTATGFDPAEIDAILHDLGADFPEADDAAPKLQTQAVSRQGDVWLLGQHRLMCGDARSSADVESLMAGTCADERKERADLKPINGSLAGAGGGPALRECNPVLIIGRNVRPCGGCLVEPCACDLLKRPAIASQNDVGPGCGLPAPHG